jgi:hypothetical protein
MNARRISTFLLFTCSVLRPQTTPVRPPENTSGVPFIRENYSKYEYRVVMRDGVNLFTAVYIPKDVASDSRTYPILLTRTPYSAAPYDEDQYPANLGPSELFSREKFIFIYQDVRGRYMEKNSPPADLLVVGPWTHGGFARGDGDRVGNVNFICTLGPPTFLIIR